MLLQRSGGYPLDIIIPRRKYPSTVPKSNLASQVLDTVSAHASRIREFVFEDYGGDDTNSIRRIFSEPAPNLTRLELWTPRPRQTMPFPYLFGWEFPKLRKLGIIGVRAWPDIAGANLTQITINEFLNPDSLRHSIPHSPNLEVLMLLDIREVRIPDPSTWQRIALPPGVRLTIKYSPYSPKRLRLLELFSLPQDCQLKIGLPEDMGNNMPSLSHVLPYDTVPLQNLRTLIRLHITARFNNKIGLELKCGMLDRPALEVNVEFSRNPVGWEGNDTTVMRFLGDLHPIVLGGVEELRMEGFVGPLEPQAIDLLKFLEGMPALTKLITADSNEKAFRSALDDLGYRAAVVRAGA